MSFGTWSPQGRYHRCYRAHTSAPASSSLLRAVGLFGKQHFAAEFLTHAAVRPDIKISIRNPGGRPPSEKLVALAPISCRSGLRTLWRE